jgi:phosphate transport system substrate-binding protein
VALRYRVLLAVVAAVPLALATACSGGGNAAPANTTGLSSAGSGGPIPSTPAPGRQTLSETGSTLLYQLMRNWVSAYERQYPNVSITTGGTGSGKGISEASAGTVNIGASDAYLSSGDLVQNPAMLNIPLAISAQQVNYHVPGLSQGVHLKLNGSVLAQMYEGKITSWNDPAIRQLNPGVSIPGIPVVPLHRSDTSGDTFLFSSYLSTQSSDWDSTYGYGTSVAWPAVPGSAAAKGNGGMVAACKNTVGCVAYIGISFQNEAQNDGLGEAQLANTLGQWELPTPTSISTAVASFVSFTPASETISMVDGPASGGYPIVNYEYAIVSVKQRSAATARDIKAFLDWMITTGNSTQYLDPVQFQPLPPSVVQLCDAQIAKIS